MTRIQLSRKKGYRKPDNTVVVSRPSRWGNPWSIQDAIASGIDPDQAAAVCVAAYSDWLKSGKLPDFSPSKKYADLEQRREWILTNVYSLKDKDLACWCGLNAHCHADVLIDYNTKGKQPCQR